MSAVPRLLADTVHNCRRGSKMHDSTWERNATQTKDTTVVSVKKDKYIKIQEYIVSYSYIQVYLSKVSLASIQRNHWWIMGGQHLPEEGQGLCERACWSQVCRWKLHLSNNKGSSLGVFFLHYKHIYLQIHSTNSMCCASLWSEQAKLIKPGVARFY